MQLDGGLALDVIVGGVLGLVDGFAFRSSHIRSFKFIL